MSDRVTPYCSSLILCDFVHKDGMSNKHSVIGIFDFINVDSIPTRKKTRIGVYAALAGGRGQCDLLIRLAHSSDYLSDDKQVFKIEASSKLQDPMKPSELGFNLVVDFKQAGVHFLQLFANNELLMEKTIYVIPPQQESHES